MFTPEIDNFEDILPMRVIHPIEGALHHLIFLTIYFFTRPVFPQWATCLCIVRNQGQATEELSILQAEADREFYR